MRPASTWLGRWTPRRTGAWLVLVGILLATGWFYVWTVRPEPSGDPFLTRDGEGYYNLLTRGFQQGRLSLDREADPMLATLKNPWDPMKRGAHGMHDVSYFHGRYYLYFGVTPILVLFLPFRLLTGMYVDESCASLIFAWVGLLASFGLLAAIRARYFPRLPSLAMAGCTLAVGLANMVPALLRRPSVWEVPITCAYACFMVALSALFVAMHTQRRTIWLAGSSLALGIAVGARPVYLFGCIAWLFPLWTWAGESGGLVRCWRDLAWRRALVAVVLPAAVVGVGLAGYNQLRFGNPLEFGWIYQLSADAATRALLNWRVIWYGVRLYLLAPAGWSPYFPFVTMINPPAAPPGQLGIEDPYGILPNIPFVLLGFGLLGLAKPWQLAGENRLKVFCLTTYLATGGTMLTVMSFGGITNRYMVDFLPALIVMAGTGLMVISTRPWWKGALRHVGNWVIAGMLLFSIGFNVLASLRHNNLFREMHPEVYRRMAHGLNHISYAYDRLAGVHYGPVEMKVIFPSGATGQVEPLVVTGRTFLSDYLFVHYLDKQSVRFGFEHTSRGVLIGDPVSIKPGEVYTLRIDMGSLYPPVAHPYFDHMPAAQARLSQRALRVTMDGQLVLARNAEYYDATSRTPSIGSSEGRPAYKRPFSGRILSWRRMPEALPRPLPAHYGPIRLELTLPAFALVGQRSEPLVSTGESGSGDLIYLMYEAENRIRFGHDYWGSGATVSESIEIDARDTQAVEIDFGALYPDGSAAEWTGPVNRERLVIRLNGRTVYNQPTGYHACDPDTITIGKNAIMASSAYPVFSGTIIRSQRLPSRIEAGP